MILHTTYIRTFQNCLSTFDEMCHFFSVYKALEHKDTVVDDVKDREHATEIVAQCIDRYIENFCK